MSVAEREDYHELQESILVKSASNHFFQRHVENRWLTLSPVCERIIEQAFREYFLKFLHQKNIRTGERSERGLSAAEYEANLQKVYTVLSVQSFWSVFNHIPSIQELQEQYSYHLMRGDRRPVWEDDVNRDGGSWRFKVLKQDSPSVWKELLLAAIGEQFRNSVKSDDDICGISITVREKDDMIQIWNENSSLYCNSVMQKVYELLPGIKFLAEFYRAHNTHRSYAIG